MARRALLVALTALAALSTARPSFASDYGFVPNAAGRAINEHMRKQGYGDRVYFVECRNWSFSDAPPLYSCQYNYNTATIYAVSDKKGSNAYRWIMSAPFNADGAEDLQAIAVTALQVIRPDTGIFRAVAIINDGMDRAGDSGGFSSAHEGLKIEFERLPKRKVARILIQPTDMPPAPK